MGDLCSGVEVPGLQLLGMTTSDNGRFLYRGRSMRPTFRDGDLVSVSDVDFRSIRCGDVVVFRQACDENGAVIHRVVAEHDGCLVTKGDAYLLADSDVVVADQLVGRAEWVERDGMSRRVTNGRAGRLWAFTIQIRVRLVAFIKALFRRTYRLVVNCRHSRRLVRCIWRPKLRVACFRESSGEIFKVFTDRRVVARWNLDASVFNVSKPYDFLIATNGESIDVGESTLYLQKFSERL